MFKRVLTTLAMAGCVSLNAVAVDIDKAHFKSMVDSLETQSNELTLAQLHEGYKFAQEQAQGKGKYDRAPAPALFYLEIKYVASEGYPYWESIADNAFATTEDHGGSWMYIVTEEGGYANPPTQRMTLNGMTLNLIQSDPLVNTGNVVIGFRNYWSTSTSSTGGRATYQATSINSPWNTETDSLTIR